MPVHSDSWTGDLTSCREGILEWIKKEHICNLNIWAGDKIFLNLLQEDREFFSLKLRYEGEFLREAVLDGKPLKEFTCKS